MLAGWLAELGDWIMKWLGVWSRWQIDWLAEEMTDWESGLTGRSSWLSGLVCMAGLLAGLASWLSVLHAFTFTMTNKGKWQAFMVHNPNLSTMATTINEGIHTLAQAGLGNVVCTRRGRVVVCIKIPATEDCLYVCVN